MRWYVSNSGKTIGPIEAEDIQRGIREGDIRTGMHVRDEQGQWIPIEQSPFAGLLQAKPPQPAKGKKADALGGCLGFIVFGIVAVFLINKCGCSDDEKTEKKEAPPDPRVDAWVMCQHLVKKRLKSPGSAEFGGIFSGDFQTSDKTITVLPDKSFRCVGWVDSQNSFGAKLRSNYDLVLQQDGDMWRITTVNSFE